MEHIKESVKEGLRVILLGVVSYLLTEGVVQTLVSHFLGMRLDASAQVIVVGLITSILRSIDKWLFESGTMNKGLTQF